MPSNDCKEPNVLYPVIDRTRCEAKADCIPVCPYDVIELRPLAAADKAAFVHGNKQAYVKDPSLCRACGECVKACPEKAIKLVRAKVV
jgi:NAD-dependent dihydropyrimidine dehydrogenase PreA subunit